MVRGRLRKLGEEAVATFLKAGPVKVGAIVAILLVLIAFADWEVGDRGSLGVLYILPMTIGAVIGGPVETFLLASVCAFLRAWFDSPAQSTEVILRFVFALLAYFVCGLFVIAL